MKTERLRFLPVLLAIFLVGCFQSKPSDVAGGGGVETTGGAIASLSGNPDNLKGARVRMIPAAYNPLTTDAFPDSLETTTQAGGTFTLKGLPPGLYNLDVWQPGDGTRLFKAGIPVVKGVSGSIPLDTLRAQSRVRIHLEGVHRGFLFQTGTTNKRKLDYVEAESVTVVLDSLPSGTLPPILLADSAAAPVPVKITDSLHTLPGSLIDPGAFALWAHQGVWSMDAAATPTDLPEGTRDYPVLLRLTKTDFDFAEARPAGEDLRFTDSEGNALPFELERWDAPAGKAEVWVGLKHAGRLDNRKILMHWGRADAKPMGRSAAVFDTASGFVCAWHLAEPGSNRKNGYADASPTGLGGWGTGMSPDAPDSGLIAGAQNFDGLNGNIRMDNGPLAWTGALMLTAWVSPGFGSEETESRVMLSRWEENDSAGFWLEYLPAIKGLRLGLGLAAPAMVFTLDAPDLPFARGEWHQVAAAYDGKTASLYWDGRLVAQGLPGQASPVPNPPDPIPLADNFRDFLIGAKGDADPNLAELQPFLGRIDEVRIYRNVKPPDWIAFDYLTQKTNASVFRWERLR